MECDRTQHCAGCEELQRQLDAADRSLLRASEIIDAVTPQRVDGWPTKPGYYWVQRPGFDLYMASVNDGHVCLLGANIWFYRGEYPNAQFWGPLVPPEVEP